MLGSLATGLANGAFWSLAPVFTTAYANDIHVTAWFMTAVVLGGASGQWPLGIWSDRTDRRLVMGTCCLVAIGVALAMWMMAPVLPLAGILLLGFLWGGVAFPLYSLSVAHANDQASPGTFVHISSGLLLMYGLGAIIGPLLASALMTWTSASGLYLFTGVIHVLLVAYVAIRSRSGHVVTPEEHTDFSESLASVMTTSTAFSQHFDAEDRDPDALPERPPDPVTDQESR